MKRHKATSGTDESFLGDTLKCRDCGEEFSAWWNLMHHRRDIHPENRRRCRNDLKGECQYTGDKGPNGCWWKHSNNSTKRRDSDEGSKETCNVCDEIFRTKSDVMFHKKNKHMDRVPFCKDFKTGSCSFPKCWYRHEGEKDTNSHKEPSSKKASQESDFPTIERQMKPPELTDLKEIIVQAMAMITSVNQKMETLLN